MHGSYCYSGWSNTISIHEPSMARIVIVAGAMRDGLFALEEHQSQY